LLYKANKLMRGGATLRSDSTDESIYQAIKDLEKRNDQAIKDLEKRNADLEKRNADFEKRNADFEKKTAALEAKLEAQQTDLMGGLKVKLTSDIISEIAADVVENQSFEDGVASLVENTITNNRPPDDLLKEVESLPLPTMNMTINGTPVDKETYLGAGTSGDLASGSWCVMSVGYWKSSSYWQWYSGFDGWYHWYVSGPEPIHHGCGRCATPWSTKHWDSYVQNSWDDNGWPVIWYWHVCN
jgi:hypothetical protein